MFDFRIWSVTIKNNITKYADGEGYRERAATVRFLDEDTLDLIQDFTGAWFDPNEPRTFPRYTKISL